MHNETKWSINIQWPSLGKLLFFIGILMVIQYTLNQFNIGFDNSDNSIAHQRSNLVIYTDYKTGCQYLQGGFFGDNITPRMDENGKQICQKNN